MMTEEKLEIAEFEAKRFLERIKTLRKANAEHQWANPKEYGAVRRASMDLTRALADLRRYA